MGLYTKPKDLIVKFVKEVIFDFIHTIIDIFPDFIDLIKEGIIAIFNKIFADIVSEMAKTKSTVSDDQRLKHLNYDTDNININIDTNDPKTQEFNEFLEFINRQHLKALLETPEE